MEKEKEDGTVAVRDRDNKVRMGIKADRFLKDLLKEIEEKR